MISSDTHTTKMKMQESPVVTDNTLFKDHLEYDPDTGICMNTHSGYPIGPRPLFHGHKCARNRLIWFVHTGKWSLSRYVLNKDGDKENTKWDNLMESHRPVPPLVAQQQDWVSHKAQAGHSSANDVEYLATRLMTAIKAEVEASDSGGHQFTAIEETTKNVMDWMLKIEFRANYETKMPITIQEAEEEHGCYNKSEWNERYMLDQLQPNPYEESADKTGT